MRTLVVIDISNLYATVKERFKSKIDYRLFLDAIAPRFTYAIGYGAKLNNTNDAFFEYLKHLNIQLKLKRMKEYRREGHVRYKANCDVDIAVDMCRFADRVERIVLCSADGDLEPAVRFAKSRGCVVDVVACGISSALKQSADSWTEIWKDVLLEADKIDEGQLSSRERGDDFGDGPTDLDR